jgi:Fe-S-cluster containining protein
VSANVIRRPVWRRFSESSLAAAAAFARAGGHAVVSVPGRPRPVWLLMPCTTAGLSPLSRWVLVLLGRRTYGEVRTSPAKGLALIRVARRFEARVADWCQRDSRWRTATRTLELECTACGACCRHCHPALLPPDLTRWRKAGRFELADLEHTDEHRGHRVIRLRPVDDRCIHLEGTRCGIYSIRPYACRVFPPGCESCLSARTEAFGTIDGVPPES